MSENNEKLVFDVAYQPQVRTKRDTKSFMLDVLIALIPTIAVSVWQFGYEALIPLVTSVASAVFFEWGYRKLLKKDNCIGDLSAVVTGVLLACSLPVGSPWWLPVIGTFFAIVIVKQLYGGIGKNFLNPAVAGRAFLMASYPLLMTNWYVPASLVGKVDAFTTATPYTYIYSGVDAATMATPLVYLYGGESMPEFFSFKALFLGTVPGTLGGLSVAAILIGFVYLLIRKVITWRIPVSFVGTVALLTLIFGHHGYDNAEWMLYNVLSGSLILSAVFMATDYVTSPVTLKGQMLFGFGCGAITVLIRYFGGYPEGVTYAILIMNLCTWSIDKAFHRHQFGYVKPEKEKGGAEK